MLTLILLKGSERARLCTKGADMLYKYCDSNNIPYKKVGKMIVATNKEEVCIIFLPLLVPITFLLSLSFFLLKEARRLVLFTCE